MHPKKWTAPLIGLTLILITLTPILYTGYSDIKQAETAWIDRDFASAEGFYLHAVQFLPWRLDLWEKAGLAASANVDYSDAIIYFSRAPSLSEQGWAALGLSYISIGDTASAIKAYHQGLQIYDSAALYKGLAYIYRQQKDWLAESEALKNQTRLDTKDVYTHYRLGLLLTFLEPEHSLSELMLASSLNPETDPAVQTLRAALNLSAIQADPSQKMLTIGRALGLVQEWELSIAAFNKAIEVDAKNAEAWAWLGEAKQQTGQDGSEELNQALELDHSSVIVYALRGMYWNRKKDYLKMIAEYQQAAKLEPDNPAWQAEIGNAYSKNGDLASAFITYQRATELSPTNSTYWRLLAIFCAENGIHVEDTGLPAAQKAVELAPNDPLAMDALGWTYLLSGRYANAEQILLDAIDKFPDYYGSHIHLAMTYLAQGNQADALKELTFVRDIDVVGPDGKFAQELMSRYFP